MSDLLDTNFHAQVWALEKAWDDPIDAWFAAVEKLTGLENLDGDQAEDGYSLDYLVELFDKGFTPEQAAGWIRINRSKI